jgi:hypothetical protein
MHEAYHVAKHHFEVRMIAILLSAIVMVAWGWQWVALLGPIYIFICLSQELSAALVELDDREVR